MSATNGPAPKRCSCTAPWNAIVMPSKKLSRPTMKIALTPIVAIWFDSAPRRHPAAPRDHREPVTQRLGDQREQRANAGARVEHRVNRPARDAPAVPARARAPGESFTASARARPRDARRASPSRACGRCARGAWRAARSPATPDESMVPAPEKSRTTVLTSRRRATALSWRNSRRAWSRTRSPSSGTTAAAGDGILQVTARIECTDLLTEFSVFERAAAPRCAPGPRSSASAQGRRSAGYCLGAAVWRGHRTAQQRRRS